MIVGSCTTLLACLWTQRMKAPALVALPPIVCNALIVGGVVAFAQTGFGPAFRTAYVLNALGVGIGEAISCGILGMLLLRALPRIPTFRAMIPRDRLDLLGSGKCVDYQF